MLECSCKGLAENVGDVCYMIGRNYLHKAGLKKRLGLQ